MRYVNVEQANCELLIVCTSNLHRMREQVPFLGNFDSLSRITNASTGDHLEYRLVPAPATTLGCHRTLGLVVTTNLATQIVWAQY